MIPANEYIESRNGGYYVAGSRIGLDVVAHAFRRKLSAEDIFRSFPSIGSLARVHGVLTFILEQPREIEDYLREEDGFYDKFQTSHPLSPEMFYRFERARSRVTPTLARGAERSSKPLASAWGRPPAILCTLFRHMSYAGDALGERS